MTTKLTRDRRKKGWMDRKKVENKKELNQERY